MILLAVALGHAGFASLLALDPIPVRRMQAEPAPVMTVLLDADAEDDAISTPSASIADPRMPIPAPLLPAHSLPDLKMELPRIDPELALTTRSFVSRAGLLPGEVVTIMLLLEIGGDGAVMSVDLVRSNGGDAANAAAIDYARETRWIPGTVDGEPRAMQASLTVILGES